MPYLLPHVLPDQPFDVALNAILLFQMLKDVCIRIEVQLQMDLPGGFRIVSCDCFSLGIGQLLTHRIHHHTRSWWSVRQT